MPRCVVILAIVAMAGVAQAQEVTKKPVLLQAMAPVYPEQALAEGKQAEVRVRIHIDESGLVSAVDVIEPVGDGFDEAAVEAAMQYVFEPAELSSPEPLRQRLAESQADGLLLLTLSASEGWVASGSMGGVAAERTTTTRLEALLTAAGSDRRLWSATCKYGSKNRASQAILDTCAQKLVERLFTERTTDEWLERLQGAGVPATPIQSVDRVLADSQVRHRRMVVDVEHPRHGRLPTLGTPIKVDGRMGLDVTVAPRLGQHTDEILAGRLKYSGECVAALRQQGVIA